MIPEGYVKLAEIDVPKRARQRQDERDRTYPVWKPRERRKPLQATLASYKEVLAEGIYSRSGLGLGILAALQSRSSRKMGAQELAKSIIDTILQEHDVVEHDSYGHATLWSKVAPEEHFFRFFHVSRQLREAVRQYTDYEYQQFYPPDHKDTSRKKTTDELVDEIRQAPRIPPEQRYIPLAQPAMPKPQAGRKVADRDDLHADISSYVMLIAEGKYIRSGENLSTKEKGATALLRVVQAQLDARNNVQSALQELDARPAYNGHVELIEARCPEGDRKLLFAKLSQALGQIMVQWTPYEYSQSLITPERARTL
jgi:hypothetical protein